MSLLLVITLFVLGAVIASFIGVVVARIHTGTSFLTGRSRCDACDAPLTLLSLVPVLSYTVSRGRAQCCGAHISFVAPLSEVLLGWLFVLTYLNIGFSAVLPFMLASLALLLGIVLYDLSHQILPPTLLYLFVAVSAATGFLASPAGFSSVLLIAASIGGSLAALHFLSRGRAMGLADAPLAFGLALLTGPAALPGFIFSFWIGAVVGIAMLVQRPRGSRIGVEVPFAPFLAAGFLLAYFTQWNPLILIAASL